MRVFHAAVVALSALVAPYAPAQFLPPQSPIDLFHRAPVELAALNFSYYHMSPVTVENTGSPDEEASIKVHVPPKAGHLSIDGTIYDLVQFHFHSRSEHTLNGVDRSMEMHIVHEGPSGELLAVGRWITLQANDNPDFAPIFGDLPGPDDPDLEIESFDLTKLYPAAASRQSWRYSGSLTAPLDPLLHVSFVPVSWVMLNEPIGLSAAQIAAFRLLFPDDNSRPIQDYVDGPGGHRMVTDVVPAPGTLAAFGVGMLLAVRRRRS